MRLHYRHLHRHARSTVVNTFYQTRMQIIHQHYSKQEAEDGQDERMVF